MPSRYLTQYLRQNAMTVVPPPDVITTTEVSKMITASFPLTRVSCTKLPCPGNSARECTLQIHSERSL
jgi:hypothetical protein